MRLHTVSSPRAQSSDPLIQLEITGILTSAFSFICKLSSATLPMWKKKVQWFQHLCKAIWNKENNHSLPNITLGSTGMPNHTWGKLHLYHQSASTRLPRAMLFIIQVWIIHRHSNSAVKLRRNASAPGAHTAPTRACPLRTAPQGAAAPAPSGAPPAAGGRQQRGKPRPNRPPPPLTGEKRGPAPTARPPGGGPRSRGDRPPLKERRGPHSDRPSRGSEQEVGFAGRPPASSSQRSPARSPPAPHRDRSQRDPLSARGSALPRWQRRPRCATQPGRNGLLTPPYTQLELGFVQVLHIVAQEAVQQIRHHRLQHHGGGGPTTRRPRPTVSGERRGGEGKRDGRRGAARGSARRVPAVRWRGGAAQRHTKRRGRAGAEGMGKCSGRLRSGCLGSYGRGEEQPPSRRPEAGSSALKEEGEGRLAAVTADSN